MTAYEIITIISNMLDLLIELVGLIIALLAFFNKENKRK